MKDQELKKEVKKPPRSDKKPVYAYVTSAAHHALKTYSVQVGKSMEKVLSELIENEFNKKPKGAK